MYFTEPNPLRSPAWDYVIVDGHAPAFKQGASVEDLRVVSGLFDYNWRYSNALQVGKRVE
jgi:hypothetical protein